MDVTANEVGPRLRELRHARSLSLQEVAATSGFSVGYLSQIETGLTVPALSTLAELAACLSADITAFFPPEPSPKVRVSRAGDPTILRLGKQDTTEYRMLSSRGTEGNFTALLATHTADKPALRYRHLGERFALVRAGEVTVENPEGRWTLGPGQWIHYSSHPEHSIEVTSSEPAELLWLATPPIV